MAQPLPPGYKWPWHLLRFIDWLEDNDPTKLAWTKINVSISSICAAATSLFTTFHTVTSATAGGSWHDVAGGAAGALTSVAWHAVASQKAEAKRSTENPSSEQAIIQRHLDGDPA